MRLHSRALILEDQRGEAVAFVVADLPFVSILLQREVAARVRTQAPIGADRLLLAATHTHSGPGHFLDAESYNRQGSSVGGYDSAMVAFLADRISDGVIAAWNARAPARIAWGETGITGVTRNRSREAGGSDPDTTLLMLRVDLLRAGDSLYRPGGALSVFAIHATGNSNENDLWDGDIQGRAAQRLEAITSGAVHLLANGAEGDVSPIWSPASRCAPPTLQRTRLRGSRSPRGWEWVGVADEARDTCLSAALAGMDSISTIIAARAAELFDQLTPAAASETTLVSRAFAAVPLTGAGALPGLCPAAEPGSATVAGAEDLTTRYKHWRFLGFIPSAFEEGGRAARPARGCQAEKRPALWSVLRRITGIGRGFPESAQLAVVRVGELLFAAVPVEATAAAGEFFTARVRAAADSAGSRAGRVAVLGLTNGFLQYVATRKEYRAQHYEGASTIYGPGMAEAFGDALAALARELGAPNSPSPDPILDSLRIRPGPRRRLLPRAVQDSGTVRRITRLGCTGSGIAVEWVDAPPGALDPSAQRFIRIEDADGGNEVVAEDDGAIEVRSLGPAGADAWRWAARWPNTTPGRYRVVVAARPGVEEVGAECVTAGPASRAPPPRIR
jgi:neutral ceramidase